MNCDGACIIREIVQQASNTSAIFRHGGGGCRREVPQRLKDFLVAHARLGIAGARR